jgi:ribosomal protein L44E
MALELSNKPINICLVMHLDKQNELKLVFVIVSYTLSRDKCYFVTTKEENEDMFAPDTEMKKGKRKRKRGRGFYGNDSKPRKRSKTQEPKSKKSAWVAKCREESD